MLGVTEPLYRVFAELPFVGSFRTPERLRFVTFLAVIVLAVAGFEQLRAAGDGASRLPLSRIRRTLVWVSLALALALLGFGERGASWRVAVALLLAMGVCWRRRGVAVRRAAEVGLFAFLVLDVALATGVHGIWRDVPLELSNRFSAPDRSRALPAGFFEAERDRAGLARVELSRLRPRMATSPSDGGYRVSCYEPLAPAQWPRLEAALHPSHAIGATLFDLPDDRSETFYDVAGVERVLRHGDSGPVAVPNEDALPRAYVTATHRVATESEAFAHLRDGSFDFHTGALVEHDPGFASAPPTSVVPAQIVEYEPERVVVDAESDAAALLVLSDSAGPGWRATRDGAPAEILLANGLYRAVVLSGGRQRVVFEYGPRSLQSGGLISLASLLALGGVALASWRRRTNGG
jgi:hypothetical protein